MRPPDEDVKLALDIERKVKDSEQTLYLECLNGLPMSQRTTDQELRDGCILTFHVFNVCKNDGRNI